MRSAVLPEVQQVKWNQKRGRSWFNVLLAYLLLLHSLCVHVCMNVSVSVSVWQVMFLLSYVVIYWLHIKITSHLLWPNSALSSSLSAHHLVSLTHTGLQHRCLGRLCMCASVVVWMCACMCVCAHLLLALSRTASQFVTTLPHISVSASFSTFLSFPHFLFLPLCCLQYPNQINEVCLPCRQICV